MYVRILMNDVRRNGLVAAMTALFIAAAATLVALAALLVVNLAGAIDTLMIQAKTPHFLQMHSGSLDAERLAAFASSNPEVDDFEVAEFLNLDGAQFVFSGPRSQSRSLAASVQDNGVVTQNERFDFLLDLDGRPIEARAGEIYLPIGYLNDGTASVGDTLTLAGRRFTFAGPLRDSQMQSMLASSKRFLVSRSDFEALRESGSVEYLIQFRLRSLERLGAFATAYTQAGLEANGPAVTYPLFRMMNALSDGMMIGLILLVSALVVAIAALCIRFTLLAKIEDDYAEIGIMKAIGLRVADIQRIYLTQYVFLAAAGSALGYGLSFAFRGPLLANIRLYMGGGGDDTLSPLLGLAGVALVFLSVILYVRGVLRRFRSISPAEAIRFSASRDTGAGSKRFGLKAAGFLGTNVYLGLKDVLSRKRLYATMLAVLSLATFIAIVPGNLYTTVSSSRFVSYMGIGQGDLYLGLQQADGLPEKAAALDKALGADGAIGRYVVLTTKTFAVRLDDGSTESLKVELGDQAVFPLEYVSGRAPRTPREISLSSLNAGGLGKKVGDTLYLSVGGSYERFTVTGIYSDVTNGGRTAKAAFRDDDAATMWVTIIAELASASGDSAARRELASAKATEYGTRFPYAKVADLGAYFGQVFGGTVQAIGKAVFAANAVALCLSALVTLLFMRLLVAKDRYPVAVLKAFGFTSADIRAQYAARALFVLIVGVLAGTLLANTLGEALVRLVIGMFGAASFRFVMDPLRAYLLSPLMTALTVVAATLVGTLDAGRLAISQNIKE